MGDAIYNTVVAATSCEAPPIKGSRFLAFVEPLANEASLHERVEQLRAEYPKACHACWAYVLADGSYRSSDDGEPGGSAGRPILAQLTGREMRDVGVVVVRHFGGTKLGVGGLIRAYGGAAALALDQAEVTTVVPTARLTATVDYADEKQVRGVLQKVVCEYVYDTRVTVIVEAPVEEIAAVRAALIEATAGRVRLL